MSGSFKERDINFHPVLVSDTEDLMQYEHKFLDARLQGFSNNHTINLVIQKAR